MAEPAIEVRGLSKRYQIGSQVANYGRLTESISNSVARLARRGARAAREERETEFWALRDISFDVARGEVVGIIGHNGAGKTTLLKLLSRITEPTEGEALITGRVGSLLEVGTGFHPELSGRENVFLNGAILGMHRAEIAAKFDQIVEFAGVERFIDTPVKRYSSGMYVRLAFAVAAHLEPEILIVDEVLSVGDLAFQEKCLGRMEEVSSEGRTVLFVSHNLTAVASLCARSILLDGGRKVADGPTPDVLERYVRNLSGGGVANLRTRPDRRGNGSLRFTHMAFTDGETTSDVAVTGQTLEIELHYVRSADEPLREVTFGISFYTLLGALMLHLQSDATGARFEDLPDEGIVRCVIPRCPIPAGRYAINILGAVGGQVADWLQRASDLTVVEGDFYGSGVRPSEGHHSVLVDNEWSAESDSTPLVPTSAEIEQH